MQRFLDSHPEYRETFDLLKHIDSPSSNIRTYQHYVDRDDLKLYKYIYKTKLYTRKDIQDHLSLLLEDTIRRERDKIASIENSFNQIEFKENNITLQDTHLGINHKGINTLEINHLENLRNKLYTSKVERHTPIVLEDCLRDNPEIKILRILLGKDIHFSDFQEKLWFLKHFKRLKGLFKGSEDKEFILQDLFSSLKDRREEGLIDRLNKTIVELEDDRVLVYYSFLSEYLTDCTKSRVFDRTSIEYKTVVLETLGEEETYKKIAHVLLHESPQNKILFLNTIEVKDKLRVYYHISRLSMRRSLDARKMFRETLDILKILPVDKKYSLLILISWCKVFLYYKDLKEGFKLCNRLLNTLSKEAGDRSTVAFKNYETGEQVEHDIRGDMAILAEFYALIYEYKHTGFLSFDKFILRLFNFEDKNIFSPFMWKDVARILT